jgi:hypothetical protein
MASKAQITSSINTINNGGNNTASEVRAVYEVFNNEFFEAGVLDTQLTSNLIDFNPFTRPQSANVAYSIRLKKMGNVVFIYGSITNNQNLSQSYILEPFARIRDAINRPVTITNVGMVKTSTTANNQYININTLGEIRLQGIMSPLESVSINGFIIVNP